MKLHFLENTVILESDLPMDIGKNTNKNILDVDVKSNFMPTSPSHICEFFYVEFMMWKYEKNPMLLFSVGFLYVFH